VNFYHLAVISEIVIVVYTYVRYVLAKPRDDHQHILQRVCCPRSILLPAAVDHHLRVSLAMTIRPNCGFLCGPRTMHCTPSVHLSRTSL